MAKEGDQAKQQLDSVTDVVQEQEVDATKAQQAMDALSANQARDESLATDPLAAVVSKDDVALIVSELEITPELAERTLREVAIEQGTTIDNKESLVVAALRKLVTS